MNCWDARSQVEDYLDNELPTPERQLLEKHLADCVTCPPLLASLVATTTAISHLRDPDSVLHPDLASRLTDHSDTLGGI